MDLEPSQTPGQDGVGRDPSGFESLMAREAAQAPQAAARAIAGNREILSDLGAQLRKRAPRAVGGPVRAEAPTMRRRLQNI